MRWNCPCTRHAPAWRAAPLGDIRQAAVSGALDGSATWAAHGSVGAPCAILHRADGQGPDRCWSSTPSMSPAKLARPDDRLREADTLRPPGGSYSPVDPALELPAHHRRGERPDHRVGELQPCVTRDVEPFIGDGSLVTRVRAAIWPRRSPAGWPPESADRAADPGVLLHPRSPSSCCRHSGATSISRCSGACSTGPGAAQ